MSVAGNTSSVSGEQEEGTGFSASDKSPSAFRTISEVAEELGVQQHVLRFWETKFSQIKPLKRGGGRRYYRPEDVVLLKRIYHLLYVEKYTIKGAQNLLRGQGKQQIVQQHISANTSEPRTQQVPQSHTSVPQYRGLTQKQRDILEGMLGELKEMRELIQDSKTS